MSGGVVEGDGDFVHKSAIYMNGIGYRVGRSRAKGQGGQQ